MVATFGKIFKHQSRFLVVAKKCVELASGFSPSDLFPSLRFLDVITMREITKVHRELDAIFDDTIRDRRQKPQKTEEEDLLDVLLQAREQKDLEVPITHENVKAVMLVN
uniref:Uncharacterized protein n=1 Tax=Ananas comosus var. bracteatus TaxID=296719 RepID=A0A6V7QVE2_ANACO